MNGPVPMSLLAHVFWSSSCACAMIPNRPPAMYAGRLHVVDVVAVDERAEQRVPVLVLPARGIEIVLHDLGRERGAVMELDARAQRDAPHGVRGVRRHRLREVRAVHLVRIGLGQTLVDRARDLDTGDRELRLGQAPAAARLRRQRPHDRAARLRSAGSRGRCARASALPSTRAKRTPTARTKDLGHGVPPGSARIAVSARWTRTLIMDCAAGQRGH